MIDQARILIAEDERIVALDLKHRLESEGYRVEGTVASGEEAIARARVLDPDLVLMDIRLDGEMNGIEAAQRIREDLGVPVIFLTAFAGNDTIEQARRTEPYGYLVKPFETRELHAMIQMSLTRRQAEVLVEESEERLRLALDAADLGVWEWRSASSPARGDGALRPSGAASDALGDESYETFLRRIHPDDRSAVEDTLFNALLGRRAISGIFRCQRDDGEIRWIELHAKAVRAKRSEAGRLVGIYKDITERKQVDERLRQTAVMYEATAEGILILDGGRRIVSVNPAFTALTGYTAEEVIGQEPDGFLFRQPRGESFFLDLVSGRQGHWQGEVQIRRRDGGRFPAWQSISVVRDDSATVSHFVVVFADLTAVRRAETELRHLAQHDPLTDLPNRLLLDDRLQHAIDGAQRGRTRFALLFIDLDGFKVINDTFGHAGGDELLKTVAERIRASIRRNDTAARFGGDEFVVIMSAIGHVEDAAHLAAKLLQAIAEPAEVAGERVEISACIGISVYPEDSTQKAALLQAADSAMYNAKSLGRGRYCFYALEMGTRAAQRLAIEQGLKRALAQGQFELHYQPIIELKSGAVCAFEALLRWRHPNWGLVNPDRFIEIAEDSGVIEPIGRWVLQKACADAFAWSRCWGSPVRVYVNVSTKQLRRGSFVDAVVDVLRTTGLPAALLELEITESTLQAVELASVLRELKQHGVGVAIDDFGTGYSSLGTLKHWPIDRLKIDRSFVRDLPGDLHSEAIVQAIAALGRAMDLMLVAEGVETAAQAEILRSLGCSEAQGFLFAAPLPAADIASALTVDAGALRVRGRHK